MRMGTVNISRMFGQSLQGGVGGGRGGGGGDGGGAAGPAPEVQVPDVRSAGMSRKRLQRSDPSSWLVQCVKAAHDALAAQAVQQAAGGSFRLDCI